MTDEDLKKLFEEVTACAAVEIHGKKDGKDISYIGRVAGNMPPLTAVPLIVGAEMLGKKEIAKKVKRGKRNATKARAKGKEIHF